MGLVSELRFFDVDSSLRSVDLGRWALDKLAESLIRFASELRILVDEASFMSLSRRSSSGSLFSRLRKMFRKLRLALIFFLVVSSITFSSSWDEDRADVTCGRSSPRIHGSRKSLPATSSPRSLVFSEALNLEGPKRRGELYGRPVLLLKEDSALELLDCTVRSRLLRPLTCSNEELVLLHPESDALDLLDLRLGGIHVGGKCTWVVAVARDIPLMRRICSAFEETVDPGAP